MGCFYPNAICSSLQIGHINPANPAHQPCRAGRRKLPRLVITTGPPEGDRRQENTACEGAGAPPPRSCTPLCALAEEQWSDRQTQKHTDRHTDTQAEGAALEGLGLCSCRPPEAFRSVSPPNQPRPPPRYQQRDRQHQQISCRWKGSRWRGCRCHHPAAGPPQEARTPRHRHRAEPPSLHGQPSPRGPG